MLKKIFAYLFFLSAFCLVCFSVTTCSETKNAHKKTTPVTYTVTGYSYDPPSTHRQGHRRLFLHNDKYGDFTFEVTPKTYYSATNGVKTMTFTESFSELMMYADNRQTEKKLLKHQEDFGVKGYNECNDLVVPLYLGFIFVWFGVFISNSIIESEDKWVVRFVWSTWITLGIGIILSILVSCI